MYQKEEKNRQTNAEVEKSIESCDLLVQQFPYLLADMNFFARSDRKRRQLWTSMWSMYGKRQVFLIRTRWTSGWLLLIIDIDANNTFGCQCTTRYISRQDCLTISCYFFFLSWLSLSLRYVKWSLQRAWPIVRSRIWFLLFQFSLRFVVFFFICSDIEMEFFWFYFDSNMRNIRVWIYQDKIVRFIIRWCVFFNGDAIFWWQNGFAFWNG